MNYWFVKSEPEAYSWSQFLKDGKTAWTGVRNFAARNNLRAMKKGDFVFFYHSGDQKSVVGLARVEKEFNSRRTFGQTRHARANQSRQNSPRNAAGETITPFSVAIDETTV
jgi:predicted RNA-binding protein with PUA-like domain